MGDALDLWDASQRLLEVSTETLATLVAHGLRGAPARRYVAAGLPAFDCEQLVVWTQGLSEELTNPLAPQPATGSRPKARGRINLVNFEVSVVRCIATLSGNQVPTVDQEEAGAEQILADGWALWNRLFGLAMRNELFGGDVCQVRRMQSSHPVDPAGGFGGWNIVIQTEVDGYANEVFKNG